MPDTTTNDTGPAQPSVYAMFNTSPSLAEVQALGEHITCVRLKEPVAPEVMSQFRSHIKHICFSYPASLEELQSLPVYVNHVSFNCHLTAENVGSVANVPKSILFIHFSYMPDINVLTALPKHITDVMFNFEMNQEQRDSICEYFAGLSHRPGVRNFENLMIGRLFSSETVQNIIQQMAAKSLLPRPVTITTTTTTTTETVTTTTKKRHRHT